MERRRVFGNDGEEAAAAYLVRHGYRVLDRQWRVAIGEIDLVVQKDGEVVFVEVKTRRDATFGDPAEAVTRSKLERLMQLSSYWVTEHHWRGPIRIDVIAITWGSAEPEIRHIIGVSPAY